MADNHNDKSHPLERRHFSRVDFKHRITLQDQDGFEFEGAFNDVSLRGMLFWCEEWPALGRTLMGTLNLGNVVLRISGKVVSVDRKRGAAIQFFEMDVESFSHLRRLVSLNLGNAELIDKEFFSSLQGKP